MNHIYDYFCITFEAWKLQSTTELKKQQPGHYSKFLLITVLHEKNNKFKQIWNNMRVSKLAPYFNFSSCHSIFITLLGLVVMNRFIFFSFSFLSLSLNQHHCAQLEPCRWNIMSEKLFLFSLLKHFSGYQQQKKCSQKGICLPGSSACAHTHTGTHTHTNVTLVCTPNDGRRVSSFMV